MKTIKRTWNVLLAFFMIVTSFYATPTIYAISPEGTVVEDGITLTKNATPVAGALNEWEIELGLEFEHQPKSQDIVLVIDRSGSMDEKDRMPSAKTAAKSFVNIVLDPGRIHNNKIALVSYSSGVKRETGFIDSISTLESRINSLNPDGGTFTQLALHEAQLMLAGSTADEKIIVLLTDGAPTFGFGLTSNNSVWNNVTSTNSTSSITYYDITYTSSTDTWSHGSSKTYYNNSTRKTLSANDEQNLSESDFNYNYTGSTNMGGFGNAAWHVDHRVNKGTSRSPSYDNYMLNLFNTNIAEARIAKDKQYTLYTVALDLGEVANAEATLKEMASSPNHYFTANSGDLNAKFQEIAGIIAFPINDMQIVDPMGDGVDYIMGSLNPTANLGTVIEATDELTINLKVSSFNYNPSTGKYTFSVKYRVRANDNAIQEYLDSSDGLINTNGNTQFKYRRSGSNKSTAFPKPRVKPTILKVEKVLLDKDGNALDLADDTLQRTYNYSITNGTGNSDITNGITTTHHYYVLHGYITHTITETSITNDDIGRFIRNIDYTLEDGTTTHIDHGNFKLEPQSGMNTITLINKETDEDYEFDVSKQVEGEEFNGQSDLYAEKGETLTYDISITNTSGVFVRNVHIQDTLEDIIDHVDTSGTTFIFKRNGVVDSSINSLQMLIDGIDTYMAANDSINITFDVVVRDDTTLPKSLDNRVYVNKDYDDADIETGEADISFTKSVTDGNDNIALAGESLHYTISITNDGNVAKRDLFVQDELTELLPNINGISGVDMLVGTETKPLQNLVDGMSVNVPANSILNITFTVTLKAGFKADEITRISNTVTVGEDKTDAHIDTAYAKITADKSVSDRNGNGKAEPGEELDYTIRIKNIGNYKKTDLFVQDTLSQLIPYIEDTTGTPMTVGSAPMLLSDLIDGIEIDLDPGEEILIKFTVTVQEGIDLEEVTELYNIATVGELTPDEEIETGKPIIGITKSVTDGNNNIAEAGETLDYTIVITNTGNAKKLDLFVRDDLSDLIGHIDAIAGSKMLVDGDEKDLTDLTNGFYIDELTPNQTVTITFSVTVQESFDADEKISFVNTAYAGDKSDDATIPTGKPKISGSKVVTDATGNEIAEKGEELTYTITATNSGNVAKAFFIKDTLSDLEDHVEDLTNAKMTVNGVEKDLSELRDGYPVTLAAGQSVEIIFKVTVRNDLDLTEVEELRNIVTIDDVDKPADIPTGEPKLSITKSVRDTNNNDRAEAGENLHYTITVANSGNVDLEKVLIKDTLDQFKAHITNIGTTTITYGSTTRPLQDLIDGFEEDLDAGTTLTITFTLKVDDNFDAADLAFFENIAYANDLNATAKIDTGKAIITGSKGVEDASGDGFAEAGEELTYTITATNSGTVTKTFEIKDDLAELLPHIDDIAGLMMEVNGVEEPLSKLVNGFNVTLLAGQSVPITFTVKVDNDFDAEAFEILENTVYIDEEDYEKEIPTGKPNIEVAKFVEDDNENGFAEAGELLHYTITIKNTGNVVKLGVQVQDTLSLLEPYIVPITDEQMEVNGVERDLQDLIDGFPLDVEAGELITITFSVKVDDDFDAALKDKLQNKAWIDGQEPKTEIPTGKPEISGDKVVTDASGDEIAEKGEELTYIITATNSGKVAKAIIIKDDLSDLEDHVEDLTNAKMTVNGVEKDLSELRDGYPVTLAADQSVEIIFKVTVRNDLDLTEVEELRNIAFIDDEENPADIPTGEPKLSIVKSVRDTNENDRAEAGENLHYTITVANDGNVDLKDVHIKDTLDQFKAHIANIGTATITYGSTTRPLQDLIDGFNIDLDAATSITFTFTLKVNDDFDADDLAFFKNTAYADDLSDTATILTGKAVISGSKEVLDDNNDTFAEAGELLHYTITATNSGSVTKTFEIKDDLAELLPHIDDIDGLMMEVNGIEEPLSNLVNGFNVTLLAGKSVTINFTVKVDDDLDTDQVKRLENTVIIDKEEYEEDIPTGKPNIEADKSVLDDNENGFAEAGELLHYTITIENTGEVVKLGILVKDTLSDLEPYIVPITDETMLVDGETKLLQDLIDGFPLDIKADELITITFTVKVRDEFDADDIEVLKNIAWIDGEEPKTEIPTGKPVIEADKSVLDDNRNEHAEAGELLHYTITATNTGNVKHRGLFIQDTLEGLLPYIDEIDDVKMQVNGVERPLQDLIDGFTEELDVEETLTITFTVKVQDEFDADDIEVLYNLAVVGDEEPDTEIPTGKPIIEAEKFVSDDNENGHAEAGEHLHYTITARNLGNVAHEKLLIQDKLEGLLPYIDDIADVMMDVNGEAKPLQDLINGFEERLEVEGSLEITFTVKVRDDFDADDIEVLYNLAVVGDEDPDTEIPTGKPVIDAMKLVEDDNGDGYAEAGEFLHYTITAHNLGNVAHESLLIQDTLEGLLPYIDDIDEVMMDINGEARPLQELIDGFTLRLDVKGSLEITFTVKVKEDFDALDVEVLTNLAVIGDEEPEAEIPTGRTDLAIAKEVADTNGNMAAELGETLHYTILVTNNGKVTKHGVLIKDSLEFLLPYIDDIDGVMMLVNGEERPLQDLVAGFLIDVEGEGRVLITFEVKVKDELGAEIDVRSLINTAYANDLNATAEITLQVSFAAIIDPEPKPKDEPVPKPAPEVKADRLPLTGYVSLTMMLANTFIILGFVFAVLKKKREEA